MHRESRVSTSISVIMIPIIIAYCFNSFAMNYLLGLAIRKSGDQRYVSIQYERS